MTATYYIVFPHPQTGARVVYISGAYTREDMRHKGYASRLLQAIQNDSVSYFKADYMYCYAQNLELYQKNDFVISEKNRLWKPLTK